MITDAGADARRLTLSQYSIYSTMAVKFLSGLQVQSAPVTSAAGGVNGESICFADKPDYDRNKDRAVRMKRKQSNKRKRNRKPKSTPDEVASFGPVRIERFGRFVRLSNTSTPEQHAEYLTRAQEANQKLFEDLKKEVPELQKLIKQYDPIELMHRATYVLMPLFLKYGSENEYSLEESYCLPTVEYLQYLIARTPPGTNGKEPSETEWEELWEKAGKVLRLTFTYLFTRKTVATPPSEIDELRFTLDGRRLGVRVDIYPYFLPDHLRTSLEPYEQWIKQLYGVGVEQIINGLLQIAEYLKTGVTGRYEDVVHSMTELQEKLRVAGYAVDPGSSAEEVERTRNALELNEFKELNSHIQEAWPRTFTSALFDITEITSLPKSVLSLLAVRPGESILTTLTGPDHDDLSPLSTSVLHYKPFLEANSRFYAFYHSGLEDHIAEIIEDDLFQKRPEQIHVMAKKRSDRLEADSKTLLASLIEPDFVFQNVYYPNPDAVGGLTELDILLGVDDILFLVEAKAGRFSEGATRGAPKDIENELSDLVIEGQRQSERAERYIRSQYEASFYDHTGKNIVHTVRCSRYRTCFRIVVTREDLGWAGAQIAILSMLDPNLSRSFPWHVSLNDLRVVAELFKDSELRFVHFLEQRLRASSQPSLRQTDELEHIGLYNKMNYYHEIPAGIDRMRFDASYMRDIDYYFRERSAGGSPDVPTQSMPDKMKEMIGALRDSRLPGRFEAASIILSMNAEGRKEFDSGLKFLDAGRAEGRQRTMRLPFPDPSYGLTITYADDINWNEEVITSAAQMNQARCGRWLVVQVANGDVYAVTRIEAIFPGRFSIAEVARGTSRLEHNVQRAISTQRPGRNDRCPCGSGKKFKKCHGS